MATRVSKTPQKSTAKRRSPTRKSPLSGTKKAAVTPKATTAKRTAATKKSAATRVRKPAARPADFAKAASAKRAPVAARKKPSTSSVRAASKTARRKPRATAVKPAAKRLVAIPLGSGNKLVLSLQTSTSKPVRRKTAGKPASKTPRTKKRELLVTAVFLVVGLFGSVYFGLQALTRPEVTVAASSLPTQQFVAEPVAKDSALPRSEPTRLRVGSIQLDTALTTVGLNPDKTLEVPADYRTAGWYRLGASPGEPGPAVVVGHLDHVGGTAVFWRLRELLPGQTIAVDRADGKTATFVIEKVQQFPQNAFPAEAVYGKTEQPTLRLITCGGVFDRLTHRYSDNIVVFATLVAEK
jgi:hypothetical protein